MQIDTAGRYTLKYTAEDSCGNITEVEREVNAVVISYRTVLYTDGTFIINEKSTDQAANEALHGAATNVYRPLSSPDYYNFPNNSSAPWYAQRNEVLRVEIGSPIKPTIMDFWFWNFDSCVYMDLSNLDTSDAMTMRELFSNCFSLPTIDVSHFNTSKVNTMNGMFNNCRSLQSLDLSSFDTSNVADMSYMFYGYSGTTPPDLSSFDTKTVRDLRNMFENYHCETLDVSSFEFMQDVLCDYMFRNSSGIANLKTIYASGLFDNSKISSSDSMFNYQSQLVGGAGTTWDSSNPSDKTYARIDGGRSNPGYFTLKSA